MRATHFLPVEDGETVVVDWWTPDQGEPRGTAAFLHGFGSHRRGDKALYFAEQFLARGWNFLTLDMRGHGDSGGGMEGLTLTRCLADVSVALDWVPPGAGPPVLIGSSMGGAVGAWYALNNPGRARAMVLIAPAFGFPGTLAARMAPEQLETWREQGWLQWDSEWLDVKVGYGLIEDGRRYDPARLTRGHALPTLIFHGVRDDSVDWRASRDFARDCPAPRIDLVLIKDGDHRLTDHKAFLFSTLFAWLEHPGEGA